MGKNRPAWRAATGHGPANPKLPAGGFYFGNFPEHLRCTAIARGSGERCCNPRMRGGSSCAKHGGHMHAQRLERAELAKTGRPMLLTSTPMRRPRRALAELGALFGDPSIPSIIERGRNVEATADAAKQNQHAAPPKK